MEAKRSRGLESLVDSNLVAGDCDAQHGDHLRKKRGLEIHKEYRVCLVPDCLPGTRMDKLADFQSRLGTALLIVDGDDSSLQVYGRAFSRRIDGAVLLSSPV
jgi:hypothetical protein